MLYEIRGRKITIPEKLEKKYLDVCQFPLKEYQVRMELLFLLTHKSRKYIGLSDKELSDLIQKQIERDLNCENPKDVILKNGHFKFVSKAEKVEDVIYEQYLSEYYKISITRDKRTKPFVDFTRFDIFYPDIMFNYDEKAFVVSYKKTNITEENYEQFIRDCKILMNYIFGELKDFVLEIL